MVAVTSRTNCGASTGTVGGRPRVAVTRLGTVTRWSAASVWSTAAWLRATTSAPRRPYVLVIDVLIALIASSRGSTPEMAKKQACSTVLVRPASPASRATRSASMVWTSMALARICSCTGRGNCAQTSAAGYGQLSSRVAPGAARFSTSTRSSSPMW